MEYAFSKGSDLTVNGCEGVNGRGCFQLQAVTGLFLVKLKVFTMNSRKGL